MKKLKNWPQKRSIALDTNALLNYLLERKPYFQEVKRAFELCLNGKKEIFIPGPVFLECEWVLRSYYKQSKDQIIKFFQELLLLDGVILKDKKDLELALNLYKSSSGISFTDCVILNQIQSFGPDEFLTFDENLKKIYKEDYQQN